MSKVLIVALKSSETSKSAWLISVAGSEMLRIDVYQSSFKLLIDGGLSDGLLFPPHCAHS